MANLLHLPDAHEPKVCLVLVRAARDKLEKSARQAEENPVQLLAFAARRGLIFFLQTNATFDMQK